MDGLNLVSSTPKSTTEKSQNTVSEKVFQPPKLKEFVDVIDLMGTVTTRIREDKRGDLPVTGTGAGATSGGKSGTTARDEAIARAPSPEIMQQKLIEHIRNEVRSIEKEARILSKSKTRGSAYVLNELYRKMRRLSSLISDIFAASTEVIKRFYISIFIDHQPIDITDGVSKQKNI